MLTKLSKWAMKQKNDEYNLDRANIMCRLLTGVLETLREFFIPLIVPICFEPVLLPLMNGVSKMLSARPLKVGNKRARGDDDMEESNEKNEKANSLLSVLCLTVRMAFKYDYNAIIQTATYALFSDSISRLTAVHFNMSILSFDNFVKEDLRPLVLAMVERIEDD